MGIEHEYESNVDMKILVTGANGYLGYGVIKTLLNKGHYVVAADFKSDRVDNRAIVKECNIFDVENPYEYFEKPDILLHLAWREGFVHYSDVHIDDLPRHFKFIKNMAEAGVKQIALLGTMHEVGCFEGCVREDTPCHPTTPYGISKNALRQLTSMICEQNNTIFQWMRGFYIVGNSRLGASIFAKIAAAAEAGEKEFPFTSGQNRYDFIDYWDFCKQIDAVIEQTQERGIINICTGKTEKLADRVERFIKENNYDIKLKYGAFPDRAYDTKAIWGDSSRIEKILQRQ